jgi:predicted transposase YbfD/YdcC
MAQRSTIDQMLTVFAVVHDPRRQHPTTLHTLATILTSTILATICGAQHWVEIAPWGQAKAAGLAEFLDLPQGIPSHDTCGRVFAVLAPESLPQAFVRWMKARADRSQESVALDGQTMRRALDRADGQGPMPVVNAWASAHERVLAQCKVDAQPHAITALPAVLRMLNRAGAVVTLEAMGCQVEIARQIQAQGADYVLSFKENQPGVYRDGDDLVTWLRGAHPLDQPVASGRADQVDGGHGRIATRRVWSTEALAGVSAGERWAGLTSLVMVASIRQLGAEASVERRYDLSSLPGATDEDAQRLNRVIRTHGEIETRVPWVLDVAMGADVNRTRKGESAQHLALLRKLALNLVRQEQSVTVGMAARQKRAGWDHDYLLKILSQT